MADRAKLEWQNVKAFAERKIVPNDDCIATCTTESNSDVFKAAVWAANGVMICLLCHNITGDFNTELRLAWNSAQRQCSRCEVGSCSGAGSISKVERSSAKVP